MINSGDIATKRSSLPWIQVGRGMAALLVVLTHVTLITQRDWGEPFADGRLILGADAGVSYFFVLSGFIIVYVHLHDIGEPSRVGEYAKKRFTRIYPLYWLVSLAVLPAYFLMPQYWKSEEHGVAYVVSSFLLLPQEALPLLSVGWTLTHEVYFYLLFGLAIALRRAVWVPIVGVVVVLTLMKLVLDWGGSFAEHKYRTGASVLDVSDFTAFLFSRFNLLFLVGCGVGVMVLKVKWVPPVWAGGLGMALLLAPVIYPNLRDTLLAGILGSPSGATLYWSLSSGLVVWVSTRIANPRPPRFSMILGDASYSLYLIHYPFMIVLAVLLGALLPETALQGPLAQIVGAALVASALAAGVACYKFVERPLLVSMRRLSGLL